MNSRLGEAIFNDIARSSGVTGTICILCHHRRPDYNKHFRVARFLKLASHCITHADENLRALAVLFPAHLDKAVQIVDAGSVTRVRTASGREMFQVASSSAGAEGTNSYIVVRGSCTCPAWTRSAGSSAGTAV